MVTLAFLRSFHDDHIPHKDNCVLVDINPINLHLNPFALITFIQTFNMQLLAVVATLLLGIAIAAPLPQTATTNYTGVLCGFGSSMYTMFSVREKNAF